MTTLKVEPSGRRSPRHKVFQPATVKIGSQHIRAHLLNVSQTGALVSTAEPLALGSRIEVVVGQWSRAAYVVRQLSSYTGIFFAVPIDREQLAALIGESRPVSLVCN